MVDFSTVRLSFFHSISEHQLDEAGFNCIRGVWETAPKNRLRRFLYFHFT